MESLWPGIMDNLPAAGPHAHRKVGLFQEEEVNFVESPQLIHCFPPDHHDRADEGFNRLGAGYGSILPGVPAREKPFEEASIQGLGGQGRDRLVRRLIVSSSLRSCGPAIPMRGSSRISSSSFSAQSAATSRRCLPTGQTRHPPVPMPCCLQRQIPDCGLHL